MKLGVLTSLFGSLDYEEMLARVVEAGLEAVELGTGNYPGKAHCNPDELLNDREALKRYKKALKDRALMISTGKKLLPSLRSMELRSWPWRCIQVLWSITPGPCFDYGKP